MEEGTEGEGKGWKGRERQGGKEVGCLGHEGESTRD